MPKLYSEVFGYASTLSAWVRSSKVETVPPLITVMRTVRDVETDESRSLNEIYIPDPSSGLSSPSNKLVQLPSCSVPVNKPLLHDISGSGEKTVTFTQSKIVSSTLQTTRLSYHLVLSFSASSPILSYPILSYRIPSYSILSYPILIFSSVLFNDVYSTIM